ncbi:MAG: suppressor of fused domain protein [Candidatus Obscuribacterales bacterium]|nr:suppressor of fused domain protein [Candidatus Obscuribacterales bacterium]
MGKKRQFKRHDDKKNSGSGTPQPPPGIIVPVNYSYLEKDDSAPPGSSDGAIDERAQQDVQEIDDESNQSSASQDESASQDPPVTDSPKKRKSVSETMEELASDVEMEADRRRLLNSAWRARDLIYQKLFGKPAYVTPPNYRPPSVEVPENFGKKDSESMDTSDPGDPTLEEQHLAVLAYGPDPLSPCWKYVTAGLASPWVQYEPLQVSGFGVELMVKSPVDAPWAAQFLRTLSFYIFNHAGTLQQGVRLALNAPINPATDSKLRNAFVWYPDEAPDTLYELPSGLFTILLAVGMTDDERKFADSVEEYGTWCVQALLRQAGYGQVTDPNRECAMKKDNIHAIVANVRNFCETFRANRNGMFTADDTTF